MTIKHSFAALSVIAIGAITGASHAANINVNANIAISTSWTANNVYNLVGQIYVLPGATLTIQAGTCIVTNTGGGSAGSLAVCRNAMIIANGTATDPIIFTSNEDVATWDVDGSHPTGKNPKTGNLRVAANEWGNITIMGRGFISFNCPANLNTNATTKLTCNVNNISPMEGLTGVDATDPNVRYGGNNDDDDSGSLKYVSLRYGGKVVGLTNELNGLSMGGVGRATEIEHVEVINNIDDGIEIWGGTVNLKWFSIWNVGDDSLDLDQGWRGKAQFGLIVQGYSAVAAQQSGVGDNCLEMDGAETADAQPATTTTLYNLTVIGQPISGDHGTAWRDNARAQIRNSIFMNLGERLILTETQRGTECSAGNADGHNGTLLFANRWTTPYTYATSGSDVNSCNNPQDRYLAQSAGNASIDQGFLCEITDSVFYLNAANSYSNANGSDALGVTGVNMADKGNIDAGNAAANSPIKSITRAAPVVVSGLTMLPVTEIDPRADNDATTSISSAPNDGFFTPANYRGAFSATDNWLCGWTAVSAYDMLDAASCVADCPEDTNGDNSVNVTDLLAVISAWGPCAGCAADTNGDNAVNVTDLLAVISAWGSCP